MCSDKIRGVQKAIGDRVASGGKPEDILCLYSEDSLEFVQQIIANYYEELEEESISINQSVFNPYPHCNLSCKSTGDRKDCIYCDGIQR